MYLKALFESLITKNSVSFELIKKHEAYGNYSLVMQAVCSKCGQSPLTSCVLKSLE
jgi:hypothetical protein